jgi:6-phosphogluconolactonase (cycloisomerase 2 family)
MKTTSIWLLALFTVVSCNSSSVKTAPGSVLNTPIPTPTVPDAVWSSVPASNTFIYRANASLNSISVGSIDPADGSITEHETLSTGAGTTPSALAVTPNNKFLYVANAGAAKITGYTINQTTGLLTKIADIATFIGPSKSVVHPNGKFLYTLHSNFGQISVHSIDPVTGVLMSVTQVGMGGAGANALAINLNGDTIVANSNYYYQTFLVNSTTGVLTYSNNQTPLKFYDMKFNPSLGRFYGVSWMNSSIWALNIDTTSGSYTGASTSTGNSGFPYGTLVFDTPGNNAYITGIYRNVVESYSVGSGNGLLTYLNTQNLPTGCEAKGSEITPDGSYLFVSCSNTSGSTLSFQILGNGTIASTGKTSTIPGAGIADSVIIDL